MGLASLGAGAYGRGERMAAANELSVRQTAAGVSFEVRIAPRASRDAIAGVHAGALKVSVTAPPVEGAANEALVALLAEALGVPKRAVHIAHGERGRTKAILVDGLDAARVRAAFAPLAR